MQTFGLRHAGLKALASLRMEKGYRDYGHDIDNTDSVLEAGLGFAVAIDKPGGFIGRDAVAARTAAGPPTRRVVQILVTDPEPLMFHAEVVRRDGRAVGYVRAASYGSHARRRRRTGDDRGRRAGHAFVPRQRQVDRRDQRPRVSGAGIVGAAVRPDKRAHQELSMWRATDGQTMVLPKIAYGRGSRLYDETGKEYIDGSGGPAVYCLGHAHPEVNDAIKHQLDAVAHAYRYNFASDPMEQLTELVARRSGPGFANMVFTTGGSEAVESALKVALHYHYAAGAPTRQPLHRPGTLVARQHARRAVGVALQGAARRRTRVRSCRLRTSRRSTPTAHRQEWPPTTSPTACADELEREIVRLGAENVAGFIFEPVVGAAGGAVPAPPGYARMVRDICDRHGVLMIADEVMCGTGRCGTWRALEHDGVVARRDGGRQGPRRRLRAARRDALPRQSRGRARRASAGRRPDTRSPATRSPARPVSPSSASSSATASSSGCAPTGRGCMKTIEERFADVEHVGDIRGRGFFVGLELVADPATKAAVPGRRRTSTCAFAGRHSTTG